MDLSKHLRKLNGANLFRVNFFERFFFFYSDNPALFTSIGCLQRLVNQLYIRRVRLLPRFDVDVKRILDLYSVLFRFFNSFFLY